LGVTGGQVSLLTAIKRAPGVGIRELAARDGVSPAAMSRQVTRLARAGLVDRTEDLGGDRRRIRLELTEEAESVLRQVRSRRTAWLAAGLQELAEDDLAAVDAAIEPLALLLEGQS